MKSSKQRRKEIKDHRAKRTEKQKRVEALARQKLMQTPPGGIGHAPVNPSLLKPYNSYGAPEFVTRGFYADHPFTCKDCGKTEIWTATQQKWWYEVAKGEVWAGAVRCRNCRKRESARKAEARRIHLEGIERKGSKD